MVRKQLFSCCQQYKGCCWPASRALLSKERNYRKEGMTYMQITACSLKFIFHVNVLEGSSNITEKNVCLLELCSAAPPGVSVLVCDHLGPLAGRVLLENLVQLEFVHIRGQVAHKHRELRPADSTALLRQTGTFTSFQMIVDSSSPFSFHRGVSQIWFSQRSSFISFFTRGLFITLDARAAHVFVRSGNSILLRNLHLVCSCKYLERRRAAAFQHWAHTRLTCLTATPNLNSTRFDTRLINEGQRVWKGRQEG